MIKRRNFKGLLDNLKDDMNYIKNNFIRVKSVMRNKKTTVISQEERINRIENQMEHYSHVTDINLLTDLVDF